MIKNAKKTEAEKKLIKFKNQLHNLLIKYPEIRLAGDMNGDVLAWIPAGPGSKSTKLYVPTNGNQELIVR
jgi:hypothetical protein